MIVRNQVHALKNKNDIDVTIIRKQVENLRGRSKDKCIFFTSEGAYYWGIG
jgi:hypothetical protein